MNTFIMARHSATIPFIQVEFVLDDIFWAKFCLNSENSHNSLLVCLQGVIIFLLGNCITSYFKRIKESPVDVKLTLNTRPMHPLSPIWVLQQSLKQA